VISMWNTGDSDSFEIAKEIKRKYPGKPVVILTPFSNEVSNRIKDKGNDASSIDYVFSWLGNPGIFVAIIKLIEDQMNASYDIDKCGVPAIILVEDSIRYYSSYLPNIYTILFKQALELMSEGLNEHRRMLRMRGRPKILFANNYKDGLTLYNKYKKNVMGVISDIRYPLNPDEEEFATAGLKLTKSIKDDNPDVPVLLQSSEAENETKARELGAGFINKYSKTLLKELKKYISKNYFFGDFRFINPENMEEIDRASNLRELQKKLEIVSDDSLNYHITHNHFHRWVVARALYSLAISKESESPVFHMEITRS